MSNESYNKVFENNKNWVASVKSNDADFFAELSKGQSPDFLFIGCADSRVPANQVMGLNPGEAFVHRNIANVVLSTDLNIQSVIEYAVVHLKVKHVVVCGHYGCGGVQAAMAGNDFGLLNGWLQPIKDVHERNKAEVEGAGDDKAQWDKLVDLNVEQQCRNIMNIQSVKDAQKANGYPQVHGWVYQLSEGLLKDLNFQAASA